MLDQARVVIIGGGSLGVSLLYHLSKEGWTDTLLIEKGELTSGSTWHAAGLLCNLNGNMTISKIHQASLDLYCEELPELTGDASPFHTTGSLRLGFTELEEQWFRNLQSRSHHVPCAFDIISKQEARELNPLMNFDSARIIVSTPNDGHVDPTSVVMPLSQAARKNGATISRFNRVLEINSRASGEWEVVTEKGTVRAEHVVNAAGCFAPEVAAMVGAKLPIINLEHQYLVTDAHPDVAALSKEMPVCRDSYSNSYIRQEGNGFLVGPYETYGSKPWALGGMDWNFDRQLFVADLERIMPFLDRCIELTPAFGEVGVSTVVNGPITHTPDDNVLAGPQAGLRNFWNLCGSSIGIAQGSLGRFMAQWMVYGETEINMAPLDCRRFGDWADKNYCITKAIESYEVMFTAMGATEHRPIARCKRISSLHAILQEKGAKFGVVQGYEKPQWFATPELLEETPSWTRSNTHDVVAAECAAVQNAAGITDISGAAKFEITGPDAAAFLDHLSCNKLPAKDGRLGLTLFHGPNGGIMTEQSITRISSEHFYLIGPMAGEERDLHWMQSHADDFDVRIANVTEYIGGVLLTGPKAREILQEISSSDLSHKAFPWLSSQIIMCDAAEVRAIRVSYAGELGYELHMPAYQLPSIYESLFRVGAELGLRDFGGYAFNSMRMEKMYRAWGHEFTEELSGVEAGMHRFIDMERDFIGAPIVRERLEKGTEIQLAYLAFDDDVACECYGNEAVFDGDELVGLTTSGGYGHRVGYSLAFAFVKPELVEQGKELTVQTSLGIRKAHVEMDAVYDPANELLRS
ncbi:MAG: GcvT family protein [Gammaproteobacteria bacterium]|nr:GcvT family protein [Gammaproteobacteria bacterium]